MATFLMILGHPRGTGLGITSSDIQRLTAGSKEILTCATCPVQDKGVVVVESMDGELSMVSYADRYGLQGPPAPAELLPFMPKGGAAYVFDTPEAAGSWYESVRDRLGLHLAYFFNDIEHPVYAAK